MRVPPESRQYTRHVRLRPARLADAAFILTLRTDPSRNAFISEVADDLEAQRKWLEAYLVREEAGEEFYFIVESSGGEDLGTVRLYDVTDDDFEWGSWIMKPGAPRQAAIESSLALYEFAFSHLGMARARFKVNRRNHRVIEFQRRFGARVTGEDATSIHFVLSAGDYRKDGRERFRRFFL